MVLGNLYVPRYHFAYAAQPTPAQLDKQMAFCLDASHCLVALRDYCRKHWRAATRWADDQPMAVLYQPGPDVADLAAAVRQDFAQRPTPQRQLQGGHLNTANGRSLVIGLFDTEEDLHRGDAALKAMDRPPDAKGDITAIGFYEVTADRRREG